MRYLILLTFMIVQSLLLPSAQAWDKSKFTPLPNNPVAGDWGGRLLTMSAIAANVAHAANLSDESIQKIEAQLQRVGVFANRHHFIVPTGFVIGLDAETALGVGVQGGFEFTLIFDSNGKLGVGGFAYFAGEGGLGGIAAGGLYINLIFNINNVDDNIGGAILFDAEAAVLGGAALDVAIGVDGSDADQTMKLAKDLMKFKGESFWDDLRAEVARQDRIYYLGGAIGAGIGGEFSAAYGYWWKGCETEVDLQNASMMEFFSHFEAFASSCKSSIKHLAVEVMKNMNTYSTVKDGLDAFARNNPDSLLYQSLPEVQAGNARVKAQLELGRQLYGPTYRLPKGWGPDSVWDGKSYK